MIHQAGQCNAFLSNTTTITITTTTTRNNSFRPQRCTSEGALDALYVTSGLLRGVVPLARGNMVAVSTMAQTFPRLPHTKRRRRSRGAPVPTLGTGGLRGVRR